MELELVRDGPQATTYKFVVDDRGVVHYECASIGSRPADCERTNVCCAAARGSNNDGTS